MNGLRLLFVALLVVLCANASAFGSTAFLSGTVTSNSPANYTISNLSNAAGSNNGTLASATATADNASSNWTISAGMAINLSGSTSFTIDVWTQASNANELSASLSQIVFTDGASNTKTVTVNQNVTGTGGKGGQDGTIVQFTINATYASGGSFDPSNVTNINFTLALTGGKNAGKNSESFSIDALRISGLSTPEPGAFALFSIGALGLGFLVRRRFARGARPTAT